MYNDPAAWDRINSFALVSYIPEPLGGFSGSAAAGVGSELFFACPRDDLAAPSDLLLARRQPGKLSELWRRVFAPFEVEMTEVEVFPVSDVIHIGIGRGREELERMHAALERRTG